MEKIEQNLDSREVAEIQTLDSTEIADMIDKEHSKLLRDIRRYIEQFNEINIGVVKKSA